MLSILVMQSWRPTSDMPPPIEPVIRHVDHRLCKVVDNHIVFVFNRWTFWKFCGFTKVINRHRIVAAICISLSKLSSKYRTATFANSGSKSSGEWLQGTKKLSTTISQWSNLQSSECYSIGIKGQNLVRIRMPGGVGGARSKPAPIPLLCRVTFDLTTISV